MRSAISGRPVARRQPGQADHRVAAPIAEPGIARDHRLAVGLVCNWPGKQEASAASASRAIQSGASHIAGLLAKRGGYDRTVVIETAKQCGREVRRRLGFDARD